MTLRLKNSEILIIIIYFGCALISVTIAITKSNRENRVSKIIDLDLDNTNSGSTRNINRNGFQKNPKNSTRDPRLFYNFFIPLPGLLRPTNPPEQTTTDKLIMLPGDKCTIIPMGTGQCLTMAQCTDYNGIITGETCSNGDGVCCLINLMCETNQCTFTVDKNLTTAISPIDRMSFTTFNIPKKENICQLLLEFTKFELSQPDPDTINCLMDTLIILGAENLNPTFKLCGEIAAGTHMFLHYGSRQLIKINLDIMYTSSVYNFLITMVPCTSSERAPEGCTQYHKGTSGEVQSFNYPNQQLSNQHYAICVKSNSDYTSIMWEECETNQVPGSLTSSFFISGTSPQNVKTNCNKEDRITIPGSPNGIYCGGVLSSTIVESSTKPFTLYVDFDSIEITEPEEPLPGQDCPTGFICQDTETGEVWPWPGNLTCPLDSHFICIANITDFEDGSIIFDLKNTGFCLNYVLLGENLLPF